MESLTGELQLGFNAALEQLYRLYIGIADRMSVVRVWACRYSK